jgi:ABC-type Mn2+/Zn2+ transport system ATPase subunit
MSGHAGPLVSIEGAALGYGHGAPVLASVDLAIGHGDFLGIVGPNGSGKSTLLKTILGLIPPLAGAVRREPGARIGYVPQRQVLDPIYPLRAIDVVLMGLYGEIGLFRRAGADARDRAHKALEAAGMAAHAERLYRDMSGGQQQRILVARALVAGPELLILDEPTNDLDLAGERGIMELVARLHREGRTVLLVSHMLNLVAAYVTRLALIHDGKLDSGPVGDMLTADRLSAIYRMPVLVADVEGRRVVVPGARA